MTGVEILATTEVIVDYGFSWLAWGCTVIALGAIFLLIGAISSSPYDDTKRDAMIGLFVGLIIGCFIGVLPAKLTVPAEYETQYKVTISDEVSMNDFLSRYEIISQEGKIYTVREINDGN